MTKRQIAALSAVGLAAVLVAGYWWSRSGGPGDATPAAVQGMQLTPAEAAALAESERQQKAAAKPTDQFSRVVDKKK